MNYIFIALISSILYSNTLLAICRTVYLCNHNMTLLYLENFTRKCSALGPKKKLDSLNVARCSIQAVESLHMGIQCRPSLLNTFFSTAAYSFLLLLCHGRSLLWSPSVCFSLHSEPTCPESLHSGVWSYRYSSFCISMSLLSTAWGLGYREGKSSAQVNLHRDNAACLCTEVHTNRNTQACV